MARAEPAPNRQDAMTTEQFMLAKTRAPRTPRSDRWSLPAALIALLIASLAPAGCARDSLRVPQALVSPWQALGTDTLVAVAPFRNESGVSIVDPLAVTDSFLYQLGQARSINTVPLNRTIGAMRSLGLRSIDTPMQAAALGRALGADAVIVGTITAFDPYEPPEFGAAIALFAVSDALGALSPGAPVDPRALSAAGTDYRTRPGSDADPLQPTSTAAAHLDGSNHEVQAAVRAYAEGRHDPSTALGWRRYLASMKLFTEFASYHLAQRLLDAERIRLSARVVNAEQQR
jgi:hypothetical protein